MEFSELSNKELKNILRENQVKNYSKLNKKELVKKVNQLIREQNGGKSGKRKYKLKELVGGLEPNELTQSLLNPGIQSKKNYDNSRPIVIPRNSKDINYQKFNNSQKKLNNPNNILEESTNNRKKRAEILDQQQSLEVSANSQTNSIQSNPDNPQNNCDACTIQ